MRNVLFQNFLLLSSGEPSGCVRAAAWLLPVCDWQYNDTEFFLPNEELLQLLLHCYFSSFKLVQFKYQTGFIQL